MPRPFVYINSAMSADGKISTLLRRQIKISGKEDLERVDRLRASSDAIMVGVGTVLADDPGLRIKSDLLRQARQAQGKAENPLRVVADSLARTPPNAMVLGAGSMIAVSKAAPRQKLARLSKRGELAVVGDVRVDLSELMDVLYGKGVRRLMVEGGGALNWSMIEAGLVDEIYVHIGPMLIGGTSAPSLADGTGFSETFPSLELVCLERLDGGALLKWRIKKSELTGL